MSDKIQEHRELTHTRYTSIVKAIESKKTNDNDINVEIRT